jgi:hypothetical protein
MEGHEGFYFLHSFLAFLRFLFYLPLFPFNPPFQFTELRLTSSYFT